jgi:hypothetical protein
MMKVSTKTALLLSCLLVLSLGEGVKTINCPPGTTLKPKYGSLPVPNGCGASDTQTALDKILDPFTDYLSICCNYHDVCYQTCDFDGMAKRTFRECNDQFNTCLLNRCQKVPFADRQFCNIWADAYSIAVDAFGSSAFNDDQRAACTCVLDLDTLLPTSSNSLFSRHRIPDLSYPPPPFSIPESMPSLASLLPAPHSMSRLSGDGLGSSQKVRIGGLKLRL